ncbi:MAG: CD225/dispanin family protein [Bacteroidota bacterium]|nr:CD225/dispanin family protein [uncultured Allomuricauda sp.]
MENNSGLPPKPDNYLVWAILSTIFCCLPTGIASIIFASKVNEAYARGEYEEAVKAAKNAKTWALIGAGLSVAIWIVYFLFFGFAILGGLASGDF